MSNHKNLLFFNKEGDYLNFNYNDKSDRFEGSILFNENSTDTFKTFGIYTMENIPSFDFELPGELTTNKFQLFNEYGMHFYAGKYFNESILNIEPINNDANFYSKWIYGNDFEKKYKIGSMIQFNESLLEFTDSNRTYTVVGSKKNAIMIISQMDNDTFESTFYIDYNDPNTYINKTVSSINSIGIFDYIKPSYANNLSNWNEPNFYDKYYLGKKLNIINTKSNNGTVTVNNTELTDQLHFEYSLNVMDLPENERIIIEVITRTDIPKIYDGGITITSNNRIYISNGLDYPNILSSGTEFKIVGSNNNTNFLTVSPIQQWNGIVNEIFFATQSQVIFNNKIYECVQAYTQSFGSQSTAYINPLNISYWDKPTHIKVDQSTIAESLLSSQLYLTNDRYYFEYGWTGSSDITLALTAQRFKDDLSLFNIDLYYNSGNLKADLIYPSKYSSVNFYYNQVGITYSIGSSTQKAEKIVGISEAINSELNYDISKNFKYSLVFRDLDEFGLQIILNKMIYDEQIAFVYSGSFIDMERTIDRTLRNWLIRHYTRLFSLGIIAELQYVGNYTSVYYNSISIKTEYPNVPIDLNDVIVGITADYYIEHSRILFNELGPYFNININDVDYGIPSVFMNTSSNITNVPSTLNTWVNKYSDILSQYNILVKNINNLLLFDIKSTNKRLKYIVSSGKVDIVDIVGINDFSIINKVLGNLGSLITSNEVILPQSSSASFENQGFSTGMVFSINNTYYPYVNQEFNIQYLDSNVLNLSYEGPFWNLNNSICNSSAFTTLAFNNGFGQTGCSLNTGPTAGSLGGPFNTSMFSNMFSISYNPNTYSVNSYNLNSLPGTTGLVDIKYIQLSSSLYAFGDNLVVMDAFLGQYITTIMLPGNTQSIEMEFNPVNNLIYCLSGKQLNIIDPTSNTLSYSISLTQSFITSISFDIEVNPINGDVYITYENQARVDIWSFDNFSNVPSNMINSGSTNFPMGVSKTGKMVFNNFEGDMYITTDVSSVLRVNTSRDIQTTYDIPGLTHSIFYEPINEAIYVYSLSNLWKIDNGITQSINSLSAGTFNDVIFNNLTGEMNISDTSSNYTMLDLNTNSIEQTGIGNYGYLDLNQFDGDVYLSSLSSNNIMVIKPTNGSVVYTAPMSAQTTKLIYNPERKSIFAIQPSLNSVIEIEVTVNSSIIPLPIIYDAIEEGQYGNLSIDYVPHEDVWLKTRDYTRRPRENFEDDIPVYYYWKWITDEVSDFFFYDFSGDQLPITGSYAYVGDKPLTEIVLNKNKNTDLSKVSLPQYQQTIFDKIEYKLSYVNDSNDISEEEESLELFIGFKSESEGSVNSVLQLYKKEEIEFNINSDINNYITFDTIENSTERYGIITINELSTNTFTNRGLKPGQNIVIYLKDVTNNINQYTSDNTASMFIIKEVYTKTIIVDFFNKEVDYLEKESTIINNYPKSGNLTYLKFTLKVKDKEIGRFVAYGQTEEEDERYKIELGNIGKLINPEEVFIFKEYDILEGGIDWKILNKKRKEMLMMKHLIYPYIGAYKSIINAINYFGYNDLQLNEYYKNIDQSSVNFLKLFKIEIPDIFDNTVDGWIETDFVKGTYPNDNFEGTNMFNLTYLITDKDGNNKLNYSVDEVVIKLQGLKYWLKKNIIPLTHKILDITGSTYVRSDIGIIHKNHDVKTINIKQQITPITFKLNEAYLMPINSGSTVYNCVLDFYSIIPGVGASYSQYFDKTKPYNGSVLIQPDYFDIKVRTYKTYKEWVPFSTYTVGDKVTYYDRLYESTINMNRVNNPRKYESINVWSANKLYQSTNIVRYDNNFYVFSGATNSQSNISPNLNNINWLNITEWKEINYEPVQTITEFRVGNNLLPYNFTIDSNIDPFIVIEVTSDNGYGQAYMDKKNYEIRGLKDLMDPQRYIDPIGPFIPISPIT